VTPQISNWISGIKAWRERKADVEGKDKEVRIEKGETR